MFNVGNLQINNFTVWVSPDYFNPTKMWDTNKDYYDVLVTEKVSGLQIYVNLHKDKRFEFIEYSRPNENTDRVEYNSFVDRKEQSQPLWKLNKKNIINVINKIQELNK